MIYVLGIDPGAHGGMSLVQLDGGRRYAIAFDKITLPEIAASVKAIKEMTDLLGDCLVGFIEEVHSMPKDGKVQAFSFGKNYGFLIGVLIALGIHMYDVPPQKWQAGLKLRVRGLEYRDKKKALKEIAQKRFPDLKPTLDTCDAMLIAEYGRQVLLYEHKLART